MRLRGLFVFRNYSQLIYIIHLHIYNLYIYNLYISIYIFCISLISFLYIYFHILFKFQIFCVYLFIFNYMYSKMYAYLRCYYYICFTHRMLCCSAKECATAWTCIYFSELGVLLLQHSTQGNFCTIILYSCYCRLNFLVESD